MQLCSQETVSGVQEACLQQEGRLHNQLQSLNDKAAESEANYLSTIASLKVVRIRIYIVFQYLSFLPLTVFKFIPDSANRNANTSNMG